MKYHYLFPFLLCALFTCQPKSTIRQFELLPPHQTGIEFSNTLTFKEGFDVFRYRNYYNGGGVALGDINNDGLTDIFLSANLSPNRLYLNKGNFKFEDITSQVDIKSQKGWSTGVSMADINADGLLDIYVCNSGNMDGGNKENELYINNGDLTFTESAARYGLADGGFSTHAVFFDYDHDGDLDCYLLNNSFYPVANLSLDNIRHVRDSLGGDKLYNNNNGIFEDVSQEAGIFGSVIGFGLGVTVGDINGDLWPDIYVSNDFFERDYLYINQQNGTFQEDLPNQLAHTSLYSMGADLGDLNNDGYPELFVTDMLPATNYRLKTVTKHDTYDFEQNKHRHGYHWQYMRNTLQLNHGDGTFSEIGQYAGISATDWSWGAIINDFDLDGNKDIFIANGVFKDVTNQDFIDYLAHDKNILKAIKTQKVNFSKFVDLMPSTPLSNYMYTPTKGMAFKNVAAEWGLDEPSFSNGAAYGDLDNDGDPDLVVNNVNQPVFVYRNNTDKLSYNNYLKLKFIGQGKNTYGLGASASIYYSGRMAFAENMPMRGFQSSMDYGLTFGLDTAANVDSLVVKWPNGYQQVMQGIKANQTLTLDWKQAKPYHTKLKKKPIKPLLTKVEPPALPPFIHKENSFVDFDRERLTYHMLSREGPALAKGDINNDGLDDLYIGGASGQGGALYVQNPDKGFTPIQPSLFSASAMHEDIDAIFFDADNDNDLDLYVVSGGNAFNNNSPYFQDKLFIQTQENKGLPVFEDRSAQLPNIRQPGSCVRACDFDLDGDVDLFVGTRHFPGRYGQPVTSRLLGNDGTGHFEDITASHATKLSNIGMVTDATWADVDNDKDPDLILTGEWLPIIIFKNNGTHLERLYNTPGLSKTNGWWNAIHPIDINEDGNMDFIAGNWGLNSKFKTSLSRPLTLFINDFDQNSSLDPIYAFYEDSTLYPIALRHDLVMQISLLKKQFPNYEDYANTTLYDMFTEAQLMKSIKHEVFTLVSSYIINNGDGSYKVAPLPEEAQYSPIFSIQAADIDKDGVNEILLGGNFDGTKPEEGKYDASFGLTLRQDGHGGFKVLKAKISGLFIKGQVRGMVSVKCANDQQMLLVARNNDKLLGFTY